jgi:hypothetical protein
MMLLALLADEVIRFGKEILHLSGVIQHSS